MKLLMDVEHPIDVCQYRSNQLILPTPMGHGFEYIFLVLIFFLVQSKSGLVVYYGLLIETSIWTSTKNIV